MKSDVVRGLTETRCETRNRAITRESPIISARLNGAEQAYLQKGTYLQGFLLWFRRNMAALLEIRSMPADVSPATWSQAARQLGKNLIFALKRMQVIIGELPACNLCPPQIHPPKTRAGYAGHDYRERYCAMSSWLGVGLPWFYRFYRNGKWRGESNNPTCHYCTSIAYPRKRARRGAGCYFDAWNNYRKDAHLVAHDASLAANAGREFSMGIENAPIPVAIMQRP